MMDTTGDSEFIFILYIKEVSLVKGYTVDLGPGLSGD